jgi:hypothetical protein
MYFSENDVTPEVASHQGKISATKITYLRFLVSNFQLRSKHKHKYYSITLYCLSEYRCQWT